MTQTWPLKALTSGETLAALADSPLHIGAWCTVISELEARGIVLARRVEPATKIRRRDDVPNYVEDMAAAMINELGDDARGLS